MLFPYHIGALTALTHHNYLTDANPIAGSSAGSIAVASHAAGVPALSAVEATVRMSQECESMGGARGNLLPLLYKELDGLLDDDVHEVINGREGLVGIAYREIFPINRPVLETQFSSKEHVMDSVCNSSMFPFFSSNWPCRFSSCGKMNKWIPRLAVDGFFTVPTERFGCPDFNMIGVDEVGDTAITKSSQNVVDRTITISVFPNTKISLTASEPEDQISPQLKNNDDSSDQISRLFRLATQTASSADYHQLYDEGWEDVERWIKEEEERKRAGVLN